MKLSLTFAQIEYVFDFGINFTFRLDMNNWMKGFYEAFGALYDKPAEGVVGSTVLSGEMSETHLKQMLTCMDWECTCLCEQLKKDACTGWFSKGMADNIELVADIISAIKEATK